MLGVFGSPEWRTVTGGSSTYVAAVAAGLHDVRTETKVTSVRELADGVEVTDGSGTTTTFDAIVIATHPSHALGMLEEPTDLQREVLAALPYSSNPALLHTDTSLLPDAAGRPRVLELLPTPPGVRRGHRDLRPHPPPAAAHRHPLPRHPRRRGPRRPGDRDRADGVRAPALHPRVGRRVTAAARDQHRPDRLRRGLPRLGLPRGRCALRPRRRDPPRPALDPHHPCHPEAGAIRDDRSGTPAAHRSRAPSSTRRPSGSSTSTTCPTTAGWPGSRRATTSARPTGRSATTSRRSSPTTASPSVPATGRARS